MGFKGSVYNPKFVDFDLDLGVSPQQHKEKSTGTLDDSFRNSQLYLYHFNSSVLKDKPVSFLIFSDKEREIQNRDFFERQTINSSNYGGRIALRRDYLPLNLTFDHSQREINRSFRPDQNVDEETLSFYSEPTTKLTGPLHINYDHNKFNRLEENALDQNGVSDQIFLSNRRSFHKDQDMTLTSNLRYYTLQNTRDSKDLNWNENVTVKHGPDLESFYTYNFVDRSSEEISTAQHNIDVGLRHKLYENLLTMFNLRGSSLESTSFDEKIAGFSWEEDYQKKVGPAVVHLGAGLIYDDKVRQSSGLFLNITDESHVLSDSSTVFLNEAGADITTIEVTNTAKTITFIRDTDYRIVEQSAGIVELRRILGGSIANGDTVLVGYITKNNPSFSYVSFQDHYRFSLDFFKETLTIYYALRKQQYPRIKSENNLILEKVDDATVGYELHLGGLTLGTEYEDYDANLTPYNALRINESYVWNISPRGTFNVHAREDFINLPEDNRQFYDVREEYSLRLTRGSLWNLEAGYRWQNGQDINLKNISSRTNYRVNAGPVSWEIGYEHEQERSLNDFFQNHFFYTKFRRAF